MKSITRTARIIVVGLSAAALLASFGCDEGGGTHLPARSELERLATLERGVSDDQVVARVGGRGVVTRAAFEALWRAHPNWEKAQVLEELTRRELLFQTRSEAQVSQFEAELTAARKRGLADAWLKSVIESGEVVIDGAQRDGLVAAKHLELRAPAGYRASHLLVRVDENADAASVERALGAAKALREELVAQAGSAVSAGDLQALMGRYEERYEGYELVVNVGLRFAAPGERFTKLPEGWMPVVPEFAQGAASVAQQGGVSAPVKSSFGWHVIVTEVAYEGVEPDRAAMFKNAERTLRDQAHRTRIVNELGRVYSEGVWSSAPDVLEADTLGVVPVESSAAH